MSYWQDKVAIVTGGSAGLGLEIARTLSAAGAKVVIAARDQSRLDAATQQLAKSSAAVDNFVADVTQDNDVEALMSYVVKTHGRLDVLVNNAGKSMRGDAISTTPDQFQDLLEVNFLSVVRCTRAAVAYLSESKGHLINIGSLSAKTGSRYLGAYPASKFPLVAYSQQLRFELEPRGIHVLLVCPGPIARNDEDDRWVEAAKDLPDSARKPGGGVKLKGISAERLSRQILDACERRKAELVVPGKARILFAISQLWPRLGDWIVKKKT